MKDKNTHIIHQYLNREIDIEELKHKLSDEEFQAWKNTLEEVEDLPKPDFDVEQEFERLQQKKTISKTKSHSLLLKIAAVLILLLSTSLFLLTHNNSNQGLTTISSVEAKADFITLPDNSQVRLNAMSNIVFSQNNWDSERSVSLKGEAYFDVEEGNTFTVETPNGTVQVLGTTFNVKSRHDNFSVTCFSGKVKVNFLEKTIVLEPGQSIDNKAQKVKLVNTVQADWMMNRSSFENAALTDVIDDIKTQKNVDIKLKLPDSIKFTGAYDHSMEAEDIIDLVCRSLDLKYKKISDSTFEIRSAED